MNTIKIFKLFIIITMMASCGNDDDQPTNPIDQLPAATQTGERTAGALVNGEALLPRGGGLTPNLTCFYQLLGGEYFFGLSFSNQNGETLKSINLEVSFIQLSANQLFQLNKNFGDDGNFIGGGCIYGSSTSVLSGITYYLTTSTITGELSITHLDETNQIISGIFWFDAVNNDGEIVEVREGRFDMPYSN
jgi:hypothetical protein